jgi:hypothetical protein
MMRSRATLLVVCAAVVAAVAGGGIAFFVRGGGSAGAAAPTGGPAVSASAVAASAADAGQVAAALRKLPADPQALVAAGAQGQVAGRARQAFPPGTAVTPDEKSWAPDGVGGGTMLVTVAVPGHAPVTYDAIMVSEGGQWKVLATIPVAAAPSAPSAGAS